MSKISRQKNTRLTQMNLPSIFVFVELTAATEKVSTISLPSSSFNINSANLDQWKNPAQAQGFKPGRRKLNGPGWLNSHAAEIETKQRDNSFFIGSHSLILSPVFFYVSNGGVK